MGVGHIVDTGNETIGMGRGGKGQSWRRGRIRGVKALEKGNRIDDRVYASGSSLALCLVATAIIADDSPCGGYGVPSLASTWLMPGCSSETRVYSARNASPWLGIPRFIFPVLKSVTWSGGSP